MESSQFDSTLGGAEHLPQSANIFKFAASRSIEIAAMTESINSQKPKLIFQNLPVHMRRRVMSHNCKRLPKKLREGHMEQLKKSGFPPKQKRPSRKYRRRPTNLLEEYNRRKKQHIRLETHIWHAKRFHMVDRWGHRLAYRPCDKAFRACYRATSAHCLLQDISYYSPLCIRGEVEDIKIMFDTITSKSCGLGVCAKAFIKGNREGNMHIFKPNSYPFGYIGKITFIWVTVLGNSDKKELWIYVHPSQLNDVLLVLNKAKDVTSCASPEVTCSQPKRMKTVIKSSNKIEIKTMSGALNRFRLTGPRSQAVLVKTLKCVTDLNNIKLHDWLSYCSEKEPQLYLKEKHEYWQSFSTLSSPSQLPPRMVLGLIVKDPRLSRPAKRTKAQQANPENVNVTSILNIPPISSISPLWDSTVREKISGKIMTNHQFIQHITNTQLIPGEVNENDPSLQSVPIVLVQRPGSQVSQYKKIGYGSGWDIIIPSGYSLPFWLTFIMFGGRAGGLRETESLSFEMGECYLPPDSEAGHIEEERVETLLKEKYFKRPPSKRVNYITNGISSPFICPWKTLLQDWCDVKVDNFFVLRDRNRLNEIKENLNQKKKISNMDKCNQCLVAVQIQILGKGNLKNNALICMPHVNDINSKTLCEPRHEDHNLKLRKLKRLEHKKALKKQRKNRIKLRKHNKQSNTGQNCVVTEPSEYVKQMRELWVASKVETVRFSGIRQTIGYVSNAAFSFSEAKSCGIGYIAYNALVSLLDLGLNHVLVRNTSTLKYRLANIHIINDV